MMTNDEQFSSYILRDEKLTRMEQNNKIKMLNFIRFNYSQEWIVKMAGGIISLPDGFIDINWNEKLFLSYRKIYERTKGNALLIS